MAEIHPFQAITYTPVSGTDVTSLVAPPYDVIDGKARAELQARSAHNIVRLTLPADASGETRYQVAARLFQAWLQAGTLVTHDEPAFYLWEQAFRHDDSRFRRRALVARVDCAPYTPGGVMRHEHTQSGPKEDRLQLFQATGAQFSQIFGIFPDPGKAAVELLAGADTGPALLTARGDDGHTSTLYRLGDAATIRQFQALLKEVTVTIADGHHRYETSLAYFQSRGRNGATLMTLVPGSDPGLVVLPTHRSVALALEPAALQPALAPDFKVQAHPLDAWPGLYQAAVSSPEAGGVLAIPPDSSAALLIKWSRNGQAAAGPFGYGDAAVLHGELLPRALPGSELPAEAFAYYHDAHAAVTGAKSRRQWAFLLRPTSVETLLRVAREQAVLPSKSTYFYPKFLAGFVNARLD